MTHARWLSLLTVAALAACSDSGSAPAGDARRADAATRDLGVGERGADLAANADAGPADLGPDLRVADGAADAAADGAGGDGPAADGMAGDGMAGDGAVDAPDGSSNPDASGTPPAVWGYVTRAVDPLLDGRGTLYIGFVQAVILDAKAVIEADLAAGGAPVKYEIFNVAPGSYALQAFLDDNRNALPVLALADPGDLAMQAPLTIDVVAGSSLRQDLVLDQAVGVPGPTVGAVRGTIRATAAPSGDGRGRVFVTLHDQWPPVNNDAHLTVLEGVDLSSPFAREAYFVSDLVPGKYYLRVFLDDNDSVGFLAPTVPDAGDLAQSAPVEVRAVAGTVTAADVVLDQVTP